MTDRILTGLIAGLTAYLMLLWLTAPLESMTPGQHVLLRGIVLFVGVLAASYPGLTE